MSHFQQRLTPTSQRDMQRDLGLGEWNKIV